MENERVLVPAERERRDVQPSMTEVLRNLQGKGYIVDGLADDPVGGMICRHPDAPPLLVRDNGSIELAKDDRPAPQRKVYAPLREKRVHWDRAGVIFALIGLVCFLGLLVIGMIVG